MKQKQVGGKVSSDDSVSGLGETSPEHLARAEGRTVSKRLGWARSSTGSFLEVECLAVSEVRGHQQTNDLTTALQGASPSSDLSERAGRCIGIQRAATQALIVGSCRRRWSLSARFGRNERILDELAEESRTYDRPQCQVGRLHKSHQTARSAFCCGLARRPALPVSGDPCPFEARKLTSLTP